MRRRSNVAAMFQAARPAALAVARIAIPARWRPSVRITVDRLSTWPPVGFVRFGSLRRTTPIAAMWPPRFGRPVDRCYIDDFLAAEAGAIHGDVLEVGDLGYTNRYGGPEVRSRSTLHSPVGAGPGVTFVADLADAPQLPDDRFDCVLLPQTLQFVYDLRAAVATLHRILRPGGVALVTVPGISQSVPDDKEQWGQYWSFTDDSLYRLFGDEFGPANVVIRSRGNVLATTAFLYGLVADDLRRHELECDDPAYPLILTVRAQRASGGAGRRPGSPAGDEPGDGGAAPGDRAPRR